MHYILAVFKLIITFSIIIVHDAHTAETCRNQAVGIISKNEVYRMYRAKNYRYKKALRGGLRACNNLPQPPKIVVLLIFYVGLHCSAARSYTYAHAYCDDIRARA